MSESLETMGRRQVLRIERRLAHPPERVWPVVTEPAQLCQWFPAEVRLEPRVGGRIVFGFGAGGDTAAESVGVISAYDPGTGAGGGPRLDTKLANMCTCATPLKPATVPAAGARSGPPPHGEARWHQPQAQAPLTSGSTAAGCSV